MTFDVAILGLGPVGSLGAILLAHAGLSVVVIERDKTVYRLPRAVNLDGEIVRALQPLGLAEEVDGLLQKVRPGERVGFVNSRHEFLFGRDAADFGANGWQPMNMFDQPELEGYLREQVLGLPGVTACVGYEAQTFSQDARQVHVQITKDAHQETISAKYLLACDGASSLVRRDLGIEWLNLGYDHDWLVVDIVTRPGHTLGNTTMQVCDPDRISTYVCTKDPYRRWEFKLNPGETREEMLAEDKIRELVEAWTPPGTYAIRRAAVYQFHAATAAQWRRNRVFIAGDAAHQTPPFLGQGMNSGMRDVVNLAWKLRLVLDGVADETLLESYQLERDAHAHDLVDWAVAVGMLMEHTAAVEAAARAGEPPPATPPGLQTAGYGQGRDQPPLRSGVLVESQVSDNGTTGFLLSQPIVCTPPGRQVRLDELLGPNFCVLAKNPAAAKLNARSQQILHAVNGRVCTLENLREVRGHIDRIFARADAVVVRPDRYIFGHTDDRHNLDTLMDLLAEKLALSL